MVDLAHFHTSPAVVQNEKANATWGLKLTIGIEHTRTEEIVSHAMQDRTFVEFGKLGYQDGLNENVKSSEAESKEA